MIDKKILNEAESGDAKAQIKVGSAYMLNQDFEKASYWFNKAAQQDDAEAQQNMLQLGLMGYGGHDKQLGYGGDDKQHAYSYYKRESEKGDIKAQYNLGNAYHFGLGVPYDRKKATYWYKKAGEKDHTDAQYSLGLIYESENNGREAASLYKKAAEKGHAASQVQLAMLYVSGDGVLKSMKDSAYWMKLAYANDSSRAKDLWNEYELWKYE